MAKKGVLLLALGSPESLSLPAIKKFLREFLGDKRIIPLPWLLRKILVEFIILPLRAKYSFERYRKIWLPEGSPFIVYSKLLREKLEDELGANFSTRLAMRYGKLSVEKALKEFLQEGVTELYLLPQFPHYAESSYETACAHFEKNRAKIAPKLKFKILPPFYDHPDYIEALAGTIKLHGNSHLLFSFHGIPVRSIHGNLACKIESPLFDEQICKNCSAAENCYRRQCYASAKSVAKALNLENTRWQVAFQSQMGKGKWLLPKTEHIAQKLSQKKFSIVAPSFTVDCLETLDELNFPNSQRIPCLNDSPRYVRFLADWVRSNASKPSFPPNTAKI